MHAVTRFARLAYRRLHVAALRVHHGHLVRACAQAMADTSPGSGHTAAALLMRAVEVRQKLTALGARP